MEFNLWGKFSHAEEYRFSAREVATALAIPV
jgi:hypothetical protein